MSAIVVTIGRLRIFPQTPENMYPKNGRVGNRCLHSPDEQQLSMTVGGLYVYGGCLGKDGTR